MNIEFVSAVETDKVYFWNNYSQSMRPHIENIWGWDETWQKSDFEHRWLSCDNTIIQRDKQSVGYIQTTDIGQEHYIMMFILLPKYRSAGVGSQVLLKIKELVKLDYISLRVFRTNIGALRFYKSQGYVVFANEGDFFYLKLRVSK